MSYKSKVASTADRACLDHLHTALNAANSAIRLDPCRLWTIHGSRGYASTWGDGQTWMLTVNSVTPRRWTFIKQRMAAFPNMAQVTQDGDDEGVFRLMRLPTPKETAEIRRVVGIRQTNPSTSIGRRFTRAKRGVLAALVHFSDQPATPVAKTEASRKTRLIDGNGAERAQAGAAP
jgi:hypothetical protein